jgi:hypothetical protein
LLREAIVQVDLHAQLLSRDVERGLTVDPYSAMIVIVVRVSDDDGTTRASTSGTIDATGTNDGVSVWRDSDQRKECEHWSRGTRQDGSR